MAGFLSGPVPEESHIAVFCHNDLGAEHLLVEPDTSTLTAVIDWSDAAVTDPAHDFGLLLRDLGPRVFSGVLHHYNRDVGDPAALRARAVFYARCKLLEDLAYGLDTGRQEYIDNALGSLPCLFGANSSSR